MATRTIGNTVLTQIPLDPDYYIDLKSNRVFLVSKLGNFEVYAERFYISKNGELRPAEYDRGKLWGNPATQIIVDPEFDPETEQYGYDLGFKRAISLNEILASLMGKH